VNHGQIVSFIWGVADLIRDTFRRGKSQDIILPLTVLRRLDCVLASTKEKVMETNARMQGKGLENPDQLLRKASGYAFYNPLATTSTSLADAPNLKSNSTTTSVGFRPTWAKYWTDSISQHDPEAR